jgi:hypothetical protein
VAAEVLPPAALVLPPVVPELVEPPVVPVSLEPPTLEFPPVAPDPPLVGVAFVFLLDEQATPIRIIAPNKLEAKTEKRILMVPMLLHLTIAVVADLLSRVGALA